MTTKILIRLAGFALAVTMLSACSASQYHPIMLCSQVAPNLMACIDERQYKAIENERRQNEGEPLEPKPQQYPTPIPKLDPRRGA